MRAVVWISEASWQICVDHARQMLPPEAEVTILHVADSEVQALAEHPGLGRLGRHRKPPPGPPVRQIAESEARALLLSAQQRFGRPAQTLARRGRIEREVLAVAERADVLVLVRDGKPKREPKSLGPRTRFVVDHAGCTVLLAWGQQPPGLDSIHWPPHLR